MLIKLPPEFICTKRISVCGDTEDYGQYGSLSQYEGVLYHINIPIQLHKLPLFTLFVHFYMAEEFNLSLVKKSADLASIIVKHHPYVFLLGSHKKIIFHGYCLDKLFMVGNFQTEKFQKNLASFMMAVRFRRYIRQVLLSCIHTDNSGIRYTWSQHYTPGGEFHPTLAHLTLNIYGDMISLL